jgi:hypothetical protein
MSITKKQRWICNLCTDLFPFNHILDDSIFLENVSNCDNKQWKLNYDTLIFNPFELYPSFTGHGDSLPCDEYDPDLHYYNHVQDVSNLCDSKYFDVTELNSRISEMQMSNQFSMFHCNIRSATKMVTILVHS